LHELQEEGNPPTRGERLAAALRVHGPLPAGAEVLVDEAARITDRLDHLDGLLAGGEWLHMRIRAVTGDEDKQLIVVRVSVDNALAEARQQALALKNILAELRICGVGESGRSPEENPLVRLADEIAKRRNTSAG
jgi:hypothetical protein